MSTNRKNRICIIIPCYNEAASLPSVAADLRKYLPEAHLLFINDASTDNSKTVLHELADDRTTVIDLPINLGIGGGVQTGLLYAARNRYDCAVKFDGDGQHPASALEDILAPVISGEADLSIGSRFLAENDGFKSTFMRRLGIRITDIRPGFVATDLIAGSNFPLQLSAECVAESIVKAVSRGKETVTIDWRYRLLVAAWAMVPRWMWTRLRFVK